MTLNLYSYGSASLSDFWKMLYKIAGILIESGFDPEFALEIIDF